MKNRTSDRKNSRNTAGNGRRHHMVIRSRFRFFTFIALVLIITVATFNIAMARSAEDTAAENALEIVVCEGDTLWDIASEYSGGSGDLRQHIYEICRLNNISADQLYPGMTLYIPSDMK